MTKDISGRVESTESSQHMEASKFLRARMKELLDAHHLRQAKTLYGVIQSEELKSAEEKAWEEFSFALENYVVLRVTDTMLKVQGIR